MRHGVRLVGVGTAALLLLVAAGAGAVAVAPGKGRVGDNFRVSGGRATGDERWTAVAWNGSANEYLIVWGDERNSSTRGDDIYGQRVSADGQRLGGNFRISGAGATSSELAPAVAWNGAANEYLVVWRDRRNFATRGWDIYGQRVSADGRRLRGNFRVSGLAATGSEGEPAIVWNGTANEYLVVWADSRYSSSRGWDIYGQRVAPAGARVGTDFPVSGPYTTRDEKSPAVAWNGADNQYLVVWQDGRLGSTRGWDIYGRRVSAAGAPVEAEFRVSGLYNTSDEWSPAVVWNGAYNEYLVVWGDNLFHSTRGWDIYEQRVSRIGDPIGSVWRVSDLPATSDEWSPAVAWNGAANQYLVVWDDGRNFSTSGRDIYAMRLSRTGVPMVADFRMSGSAAIHNESNVSVAWSGANEYLVVWVDGRNWATRGDDIYAQRVSG